MFVHLVPDVFASLAFPESTISIFHVDINVNFSADVHVLNERVSVHFFYNTESTDDLAFVMAPAADFNAAIDLIAEFEAASA